MFKVTSSEHRVNPNISNSETTSHYDPPNVTEQRVHSTIHGVLWQEKMALNL